jgi:hypothetical protein
MWSAWQRARWGAAVALCLLAGAGSLAAQGTTGKIEGTVKDQSGTPIAGAQVFIVGSAFQATTDETGYFFLNNVPAGVVTVRAQYIGYTPNEVRNVRVLAGQTMTVNPVLEQRAIELTGITVTVEQNPMVPRDQVTSKPIVQGETIQELPVDAVSQVLRLQPGVVEGSRGLSIRGSRPGTEATYIDGVLVRNYQGAFGGIYGTTGLATNIGTAATVGTNAVQEVSVTTGAVGAAYGEAEGGVIALVTRAGGAQYHGSVSYATDDVSGQVYGMGLNRVEASFGGPMARNLTFFVATTLQGQQNGPQPLGQQAVPQFQLAGYSDSVMVPLQPYLADGTTPNPTSDSQLVRIPRIMQYASGCTGVDALKGACRSTRRLDANRDQTTLDGKLQYTYGTGSRLAVTYHLDRNQALNGINYDPVRQTGSRAMAHAIIASWTQTVATSSTHALVLDASLSWQRDQYTDGLVQPGWMEGHQNPFGWFNASNIQFITDFSSFPVDDRLIENVRLNNCRSLRDGTIGGCVPYIDRNDFGAGSAYRFNPYGVSHSQFANEGLGFFETTRLTRETRIAGKASVDWQANRYNRVQIGADIGHSSDLAWSGTLIFPYVDAYKVSPRTLGLYGQDRIDLGDVVIEVGLRYDRMDTGILYPRVPGRIITDPLRDPTTTLAQKLAISFNAQDSSMANACQTALAASDSLALSTCNYFKASPQAVLSPTLRVSFPVSDRTGFRLSYSHQVQTPDISLLAGKTNTDLAFTSINDLFGRPAGFGRTILFEFGIRHAFGDDMVLDISAYNKDQVSEIAARPVAIFDPFIGCQAGVCQGPGTTDETVNVVTNADFGNSRGVDIRLDRRFGAIFQGTISYTFQTAKNTGSDPYQYLNTLANSINLVTNTPLRPPEAFLTSSDNRTHTIAGNFAATFPSGWHRGTLIGVILENSGIYGTFRFASGLAYTLMQNGGLGLLGPGNPFGFGGVAQGPVNSSTMPWIKNVDLRVTRGFRVAGTSVSAFADFRNLFNWRNLTAIFAETGDVVNSLHRAITIVPQTSLLTSDAGALWVNQIVTVNGVQRSLSGVDLRDCSRYPRGDGGVRGVPDCLMLRQVEARFGNGDQFFDTNEIATAFNAWYQRFHGPQTLNGPGFNLRLGFELNF